MSPLIDETEVITQEPNFVLVEVISGPKGDKGDPGEGSSTAGSVRVDASNPSLVYRGAAPVGSEEDESVWAISRLTVLPGDHVVVSRAMGTHTWASRNLLEYV